MPFVSIIVPVYKTEAYLEKCIESIRNQSYTDYELILVNDGSPDRCPQICDDYAARDRRIKVIHKENGGVSSARNVGIDLAQGEYIWFIDSDDYIEENALEQLKSDIEKKNADMVVFNTKGVNVLSIDSFDEFLEDYYFTYIIGFAPWNKLYKTSVIKGNNLKFDVEESIGEDLLFNISYYKALYGDVSKKRFLYISKDYYNYVDRSGSAMNTASKTRIIQQMRLYDKIYEMLNGVVRERNLNYFFWSHLISGTNQSKQGGLKKSDYLKYIAWRKYEKELKSFDSIREIFFKNEKASFLGRIRVVLFSTAMKRGLFTSAAIIMGIF